MKNSRERILIVENDPGISDLISRQTLEPQGYRVEVVRDASAALGEAGRFSPDLIIANLNLPDLSGKDLLVAINSQGVEIPMVIIAQIGMEADVIHAFRLGAVDHLICPLQEAEVLSVVERVLKQVRAWREREFLARQLKQANEELQRRVRDLTAIFAVGKAITSLTNQQDLFDRIVEGAVTVAEADCGWLLLREQRGKSFTLTARRNMPENIAAKLNQPWDDGISSLVALSGEMLSIYGEPLKRFRVSQLGQSALVMPVKIKRVVMGVLVVVRKEPYPFTPNNKAMLEAVADYASISLVNARMFQALEERARSLQRAAENARDSERYKDEILQKIQDQLKHPLASAMEMIDSMLIGENSSLEPIEKDGLRSARENLQQVLVTVETLDAPV